MLIGTAGLLGLVVLGLAATYLYIGYRAGIKHDVSGVPLAVPGDAESIAEGERLARVRGCMGGCHGRETGGNVFFTAPDGSRVIAPDLGRVAADYSIPELERVIRHGIRPDGTSVMGLMPSPMFYGLGDEDLASIVAFLKSRPPGNGELPGTYTGPLLRAMLAFYSWKFDWDIFAAEAIDHDVPRLDATSDDQLVRGEYLATTVCSECHGDELQGGLDGSAPSLAITIAYSRDDFGRLMHTGTPIGGRELELMKKVALNRFTYFTEPEIDDLHAYLQTLAAAD